MARPPLPSYWRYLYLGGMRGRAFGKVEVTPNRGQVPDYLTVHAGGTLGEFYCADTAAVTAADTLGHASPLILSGSCMQQRQRAKAKGALIDRAEFDRRRAADPLSVLAFVMLLIDPTKPADGVGLPGHAHHAAVVGDVDVTTGRAIVNGPRGGFLTCEGNASDPTKPPSTNGDGIYHGRERGHPLDHSVYEFIDLEAFPLA